MTTATEVTYPEAIPTLFVPHGAPTFALRPGVAGAVLNRAASRLPSLRAILVISAHWETTTPRVGFTHRPKTIHDFWGFAPALYQIHYPATGCPEVGQAVVQALQGAGFDARADSERGLDHGAWIPLRFMFAEADVPVLPLSIQPHQDAAYHYRLGQALAPLTRQGILVLASGNLTHNLRDYLQALHAGGVTPPYVRQFSDWIWDRLQQQDLPALLDYRALAPEGVRAHPSDEHLLPLYVALGAAGAGASAERLHAGIDDYVIAMDSFMFHREKS